MKGYHDYPEDATRWHDIDSDLNGRLEEFWREAELSNPKSSEVMEIVNRKRDLINWESSAYHVSISSASSKNSLDLLIPGNRG